VKPRLLFVDDDPQILRSLARIFRSHVTRWELVFAENALIALDLLQRDRFDLVVTDLEMPGMTGAALLAEVKRAFPSTVRILLTGSEIDPSTVDADCVLAKPFDQQLLREEIEAILESV